jgi:3'-phosphoadenosine 5'-phosphosulfate (PAPS) 3'-phosphatase
MVSTTPNSEPLHFSPDLRFGVISAVEIGRRIYSGWKTGLNVHVKEDQTLVSTIEEATNTWFNGEVGRVYGKSVEVMGEEVPLAATAPPKVGEPTRIWTLDTGDGSGELAATHRAHRDANTGDPINPTKPMPPDARPEPIAEAERTTCTGVGLIKDGKVWSGVAYNPFQGRLLVADRDLQGTFQVDPNNIQPDGTALGSRLEVNEIPVFPGSVTWDHATWEGGAIEVGQLQQALKTPPQNHYSAIDQAAQVALGASSCAVFAGDTLHDIIPSVALVHWAGGVAFEPSGKLIDPDNFTPPQAGAVYSNRVGYLSFMGALQTGQTGAIGDTPCVTDYEGVRFPMPLSSVLAGVPIRQTAEQVVDFGHHNGEPQPGKIVVKGFGYQRTGRISQREARRLRSQTRKQWGAKWTYRNHQHANGTTIVGIARVSNPEQTIEVDGGNAISAGELVRRTLRAAVSDKIRQQAERYRDVRPSSNQ